MLFPCETNSANFAASDLSGGRMGMYCRVHSICVLRNHFSDTRINLYPQSPCSTQCGTDREDLFYNMIFFSETHIRRRRYADTQILRPPSQCGGRTVYSRPRLCVCARKYKKMPYRDPLLATPIHHPRRLILGNRQKTPKAPQIHLSAEEMLFVAGDHRAENLRSSNLSLICW